jgi:phage terminase large subunit GpA-like protein
VGVLTSSWELVEPTRRNEGLDTMLYAEAAARRKGWTSLTEDQWARLDAERAAEPTDAQPDLFDATVQAASVNQPAPDRQPDPAPRKPRTAQPPATDWLGGRGSKWQ